GGLPPDVTGPPTLPATPASGTDAAPPLSKSAATAFLADSCSPRRLTTTMKTVAHRATMPARMSAVRTPRGMRGFWLNVARCSSWRVGDVAVTRIERVAVVPNHGRGPSPQIAAGL